VDLFAARLTGPASVITAPEGSARVLVRPGWARLGGPLEAELRAVWFRGPHSDYLAHTELGQLLIREPGPPRHAVGARVGWTLLRGWPLAGPPA
jgi:iron(III) transport system ATP-binding protein